MGTEKFLLINFEDELANEHLKNFINNIVEPTGDPSTTISSLYIVSSAPLKLAEANYVSSDSIEASYQGILSEEDQNNEDYRPDNLEANKDVNEAGNQINKASNFDEYESKAKITEFNLNPNEFNFTGKIINALNCLREETNHDDKVKVLICGHGNIMARQHYMGNIKTDSRETIKTFINTGQLFNEITNKLGDKVKKPVNEHDNENKGLEIAVLSCFSGFLQNFRDNLPEGSKLYTFTDEAKAQGEFEFIFDLYPKGISFDIIKFAMFSQLKNSNNQNFLIEKILRGISAGGVSQFKFSFDSEKDGITHKDIYNYLNYMYNNNEINKSILESFMRLEKQIYEDKKFHGKLLESLKGEFAPTLNLLSLKSPLQVDYKPSDSKVLKTANDSHFKIEFDSFAELFLSSDSLEDKIIHKKPISALDILAWKDSWKHANIFKRTTEQVKSEFYYYAALNDGDQNLQNNSGLIELELTAGVNTDYLDNEFLTILIQKSCPQELCPEELTNQDPKIFCWEINVELTSDEATNLATGGEAINLENFLLEKACEELYKHPISGEIKQERLTEIKNSLTGNETFKIICDSIDEALHEGQLDHQISQLEINDQFSEEFLTQIYKNIASGYKNGKKQIGVIEQFSESEKYIKYTKAENKIHHYDSENNIDNEYTIADEGKLSTLGDASAEDVEGFY